MLEPCSTDANCSLNELCFKAGESWSNVSMCYCNTYYGFSGEDCSQTLIEPNALFFVIVGALGIVSCSIFTAMSLSNLVLLYRAAPVGGKRSLVSDPVFQTTCFFFLGGILLVTNSCILVYLPTRPFQPTLATDETTMELDASNQQVLTVGLMFLAFGIITVALGFLEIAVNLKPRRRQMIRWAGIIYKLSLGFSVVALVGSRKIHLALMVSFPFTVILAITYTAGFVLLTRKIKKLAAGTDRNNSALKALKTTQVTVLVLCVSLICEIGIGILWCVTSLFIGWRFFTQPGIVTVCLVGNILWIPSIIGCFAILRDITSWRNVRLARKFSTAPSSAAPRLNAATFPSRTSKDCDERVVVA